MSALLTLLAGWGQHFSGALPLRSDLPIYPEDTGDIQPSSLWRQGITGYESVFLGGDWRSTFVDCAAPMSRRWIQSCEAWLRWNIFGPIHGGYVFQTASTREGLNHSWGDDGIAFSLGRSPLDESVELFALSFGRRYGASEYLLIAATDERPATTLSVLFHECVDESGEPIMLPGVEFRDGDFFGDYCVVHTAEGLRALAVAAWERGPTATLEWIDASPEEDLR